MEKKIFLSYSHKDKKYLSDFRSHFSTVNEGALIWDDSKISVGQNWKFEIDKALKSSIASILFVSSNFLNSKFIMEEELPYILESSEEQKKLILLIFLKPVLLDNFPKLAEIQGVNSPNNTLLDMNEAQKERLWVQIIKEINAVSS